MKNVLKTLGIICIIGAALLVAACGPGEDATFTVTFDTDGGTPAVPAQKDIPKDGKATEPTTNPTKPAGALPAKPSVTTLYKLSTTAAQFDKWTLDGEEYDFSTPVTKNITLKATYTGGGAETVSLSGTGDAVSQAVTAVNAGGNTDKWVLYLGADVNPATNNWALQKGELTIDSTATAQRIIKSPAMSGTNKVYMIVGQVATPTNIPENNQGKYVASPTATPTLTLKNIKLQGTGTAIGDSLVLVISGGTLILDTNTVVSDHKNSATTSSGLNGNGSAVCLYGGNLTMKGGAIIEKNESTQSATGGNRNRVGGVYTYVPNNGKVNLNITGGIIEDNDCTEGNTKDLYATEGGVFTLGGNVTIGELTINADVPDPGTTTANNAAQAVAATIVVSGLANNVGKLSLRSTAAIDVVKTVWTTTGKQVLSGPLSGTNTTPPAAADVAKFTLGDFKGNAGFEAITGFELGSDGKLKAK